MSNIQPRRRSEAINVGRPRPVRVVWPEDDRLNRADRRRDRWSASRHVVRLNDFERQAEAGAAEVARDGVIAVAEVEADRKVGIAEASSAAAVATALINARRQYNYEAKQEMLRARKES